MPPVARDFRVYFALVQSPEVARYTKRRTIADRPSDIAPVPIEGPPIPTPPDKLRHLHFNDALLAHIAMAQSTS
ncbi:hypothetical protein SB861_06670 [Paraburkholderia sp. SIMBA_049]